MAKRYENGKTAVLRHALHCAIRDREDMLDSLRAPIYNASDLSREELLAKFSVEDGAYYLEIEGWIRDFKTMLAGTRS